MSHFAQRFIVLKDLSFCCFLISIVTAAFGMGLSYVITSWLVVQNAPFLQTNSILPVAILMICFWLPSGILGPFMGVLVDRYSRKKILLVANGGRAILWTCFGLYYLHAIPNNAIYLLCTLSGVLLSLYLPAAMAFIREIIAEQHLLHANANIDMAFEIGHVIGMGATGLWLLWFSAESAILMNGICFIVSTLFMIPIQQKIKNKNTVAKLSRVFAELREGLSYLKNDPKVLLIYTLQLIVFVQLMTTPIMTVPFAKSVLHASVAQFGQIEAAMSVGVVLGGLFVPWLTERHGFKRIMIILSWFAALFFAVFGFNHNIKLAILLYFSLGLYFAIWASLVTKAQELTEFNYQGRAQSAFSSLSALFILLNYAAVELGNQFVDLSSLYFFETALSLIALAIIYLTRKRIFI